MSAKKCTAVMLVFTMGWSSTVMAAPKSYPAVTCKIGPDGPACVPQRGTFGYVKPTWRRWPNNELASTQGKPTPAESPTPATEPKKKPETEGPSIVPETGTSPSDSDAPDLGAPDSTPSLEEPMLESPVTSPLDDNPPAPPGDTAPNSDAGGATAPPADDVPTPPADDIFSAPRAGAGTTGARPRVPTKAGAPLDADLPPEVTPDQGDPFKDEPEAPADAAPAKRESRIRHSPLRGRSTSEARPRGPSKPVVNVAHANAAEEIAAEPRRLPPMDSTAQPLQPSPATGRGNPLRSTVGAAPERAMPAAERSEAQAASAIVPSSASAPRRNPLRSSE